MAKTKYLHKLLCLIALFCGVSTSAMCQSEHALSEAEKMNALAVEAKTFSERQAVPASLRGAIPGLSKTTKGVLGKTAVVSVVPVGSASTVVRHGLALSMGSASLRRAVITRYEYATGLTIRTWVDLGSNVTVATRSDANYPTPLAPEELTEAKELLQAKVEEINKILSEGSDSVRYAHLVPVSSNAAAPRYGHRLVWLWLTSPVYTEKYLIDLSTNEVEKSS